MNISVGEKVLLITGQRLAHIQERLVAEILPCSPAQVWTYTLPDAERPFLEYPPLLHHVAAQADAVIVFYSRLQPEETPGRLVFWRTCRGNRTRVGFGPQIEDSILQNELSADYQAIATITRRLKRHLEGRDQVSITTPLGTELTLSIAGRDVVEDTGLIHNPGQFGNLPAGECFVAPLEDSAEGVLVVDKSFPELVVEQPVRMIFEKGRVVAIEGGAEAEELLRRIGTNPKARLTGRVITDEKVMGTIHVAIGDNASHGYGVNPAPIHIDGIVGQPTLVVGGETLIEKGRYLV
jgi:leucyl aminopeptidase (aminopeptidase T)